jgi:Cu(I)/Ag(I) efflux system membrane protein CusA/SilA
MDDEAHSARCDSDLSDTQVIIYSRWDRSPDILEDQVTYPIVTTLLAAPHVKAVRAQTMFGDSYVFVVFQDGTDLYWARSRVLEYLSKILPRLPEGVRTEIGPDATSVGWVYQYALVDHAGTQSLADLRSLQDWYLRYNLQSVPGVADVAAVGGFVKQYQVNADPNRLLAYNIPSDDSSTRSARATRRSGAASSSLPGPSTWSAAAVTFGPSKTSRTSSWRWMTRRGPRFS